ncbi:AIPR family protein, partial [Gemmatimonas sp.]|uniref:AIPR family protein n=1 Tax=Gemmatimonas sp. TaxID=1962908 RepID=UPI00356906A0
GTAVLEKLLKELNGDDPNQIATSEVMGLETVYHGLTSDAGAVHVSLDAQLFDWSYVSAPYPAYFGLIDGLQLKAWWKQHARRLVAANIRHALGATDVNTQIRLTATTAPESFWYFNDGITVVADAAVKAPAGAASRTAGNFTFTGASIVNGAQTVSSLGGIDDDERLGKIRVSIRVIVLESAPVGFGKEVTRTNNLQNRIEPRDFAAQDPEQLRLRQEMSMEGVDYQFVRSEEAAPAAMSCELLEVTTALACASADAGLAVQVKTGLGRFFNDLTKPPNKALFNPSTTGTRAFNATLVQRAIDGWIDAKRKGLIKKSGPTWGVLVHGNLILAALAFKALGQANLRRPIQEFQKTFKPLSLDSMLEKALTKSVATIKKHYDGRHLAVLFKNPSASKQVFDLASG